MKITKFVCILVLLLTSLLQLPTVHAAPETAKLQGLLKQSDEITALQYSPDGRMIATAGGKIVRLWDAKNGKLLRLLKNSGSIHSLQFSHDGQMITMVSGKTVQLWDAKNGKLLHVLKHSNVVRAIDISSRGTIAVICEAKETDLGRGDTRIEKDSSVRFWNTKSGKLEKQTHLPSTDIVSGYSFGDVAFSRDGLRLAVVADSGFVQVIDVATNKIQRKLAFRIPDWRVTTTALFSPDGKHLLVSFPGFFHDDDAPIVAMYEIGNGNMKWELEMKYPHMNYSASFASGGSWIVSSTSNPDYDDRESSERITVETRDVQTGNLVNTFDLKNLISYGSWSRDGETFATFPREKQREVQLRDAQNGKLKVSLKHSDEIRSVTFSPDGEMVACAGDKVVRLWQIS